MWDKCWHNSEAQELFSFLQSWWANHYKNCHGLPIGMELKHCEKKLVYCHALWGKIVSEFPLFWGTVCPCYFVSKWPKGCFCSPLLDFDKEETKDSRILMTKLRKSPEKVNISHFIQMKSYTSLKNLWNTSISL